MKQLDPKAVWLFFLSSLPGFIILLPVTIFGINLLSSLGSTGYYPGVASSAPFLFGFLNLILIFATVVIIISYVWAHLTYKNYKYELREDGFRKEHGIIWKKYVTIPYERIQNVDIYRGLLARLLGLSDLNIQTAGMSTMVGSYGGGSEGRLPALSPQVAEELRDELVRRARHGSKSQGL